MKWDLLLAAEAYGLAPQGTYLYPNDRKRPHATKPCEMGLHLNPALGRKTKTRIHVTKSINPEYLRKTGIAAQLADDAWLRGGLDAMDADLKWLRRNDADPVIIDEFARLYHKQMRQMLPAQRLAPALVLNQPRKPRYRVGNIELGVIELAVLDGDLRRSFARDSMSHGRST